MYKPQTNKQTISNQGLLIENIHLIRNTGPTSEPAKISKTSYFTSKIFKNNNRVDFVDNSNNYFFTTIPSIGDTKNSLSYTGISNFNEVVGINNYNNIGILELNDNFLFSNTWFKKNTNKLNIIIPIIVIAFFIIVICLLLILFKKINLFKKYKGNKKLKTI